MYFIASLQCFKILTALRYDMVRCSSNTSPKQGSTPSMRATSAFITSSNYILGNNGVNDIERVH